MSRAVGTRDGTTRPLTALIAAHEAIDWREVDGVSVAEAAAWTKRLREAKERQTAPTSANE